MSVSFGTGLSRLQLLASDGAALEATLYLPTTDMGGISLSYDDNKQIDEMLDGRLDITYKGFYPKFSCKWTYYDESSTGYPVGILDSNTPTAEQLMNILTSYRPGRLQFSPSLTSPFYIVYLDKLPQITPISDYATSFDFSLKTIGIWSSSDNTPAKALS